MDETQEPLTVGTVVMLASGGPHMTVWVVGEPDVECRWFDEAGIIKKAPFLPLALVRVPGKVKKK